MKDLHSGILANVAINTAVLTADTTGPTIDRQGFEGIEFVLGIGAGGIPFTAVNMIDFKLEHSDNGTAWAAVEAVDVIGASVAADGIVKSLVEAHPAAAAYRFGYKGGKRYTRVSVNFSGAHATGTPISAIAIMGRPAMAPQPDQI